MSEEAPPRGGGFLAAQPQVSTAVVRQSLWAKLGSRAKPFPRLLELEVELKPLFAALPKNEHGNIERDVVRYASRRYFVQAYGWHLKGLESYHASSSFAVQSVDFDVVPSYVLDIFEDYIGEQGFGILDLAIFLATLEDLVNADMLKDVVNSYRLHGFPTEGQLPAQAVDDVVITYMASYILGMNISNVDLESYKALNMEESYPGWTETVMWVSDVRKALEFTGRSRANPFVASALDLTAVEHIVSAIGRRYGSFQDLECRSLKSALLSLEHRNTGRVLLSDFYKQSLSDDWQFSESVPYLRDLGALDESYPTRPSVLVPNYLTGPSNCLVSTSFYTVCCIDECNALFHQLEMKLASPLAEASQVAEAISNLPSDTVQAPRNLSDDLQRRLRQIAEHHNGQIPLHGRLFAQFMHHAYPRECSFPHVSGTTAPMTQDDWVRVHGADNIMASETEKHAHVSSADSEDIAWVPDFPWHLTEELVAQHRHHGRHIIVDQSGLQSWLVTLSRGLLFIAPLSLAAHLLRSGLAWVGMSAKQASFSSGSEMPNRGRDFFV